MTNSVHVVPVGDLMQHDTDAACACGPTIQAVKDEHGNIGWMYVHRSLDGREWTEID